MIFWTASYERFFLLIFYIDSSISFGLFENLSHSSFDISHVLIKEIISVSKSCIHSFCPICITDGIW
jgi:hypothetical protein